MGYLPCPFCGCKEIRITMNIAGRYFCVCNYCGSAGRDSSDSSESVDFWNKRAAKEITFEDMRKSLFQETPHTWNKLGEPSVCSANYSIPGMPTNDELQAENDLLKGQIEQLENYAADLRIAMRKARKMLRFRKVEGLDIRLISNKQVDEARQILKEALKTE